MTLSITPLLIHHHAVPPEARDALRAAALGPAEDRVARLESAALAIYRATDLDCREAREIVGLPDYAVSSLRSKRCSRSAR